MTKTTTTSTTTRAQRIEALMNIGAIIMLVAIVFIGASYLSSHMPTLDDVLSYLLPVSSHGRRY